MKNGTLEGLWSSGLSGFRVSGLRVWGFLSTPQISSHLAEFRPKDSNIPSFRNIP